MKREDAVWKDHDGHVIRFDTLDDRRRAMRLLEEFHSEICRLQARVKKLEAIVGAATHSFEAKTPRLQKAWRETFYEALSALDTQEPK